MHHRATAFGYWRSTWPMLPYVKRPWSSLMWLNITLPAHVFSEWVRTCPARPPARGFNGLWLRRWSPRWDDEGLTRGLSDNKYPVTISYIVPSILSIARGVVVWNNNNMYSNMPCSPSALHRQWQRGLVRTFITECFKLGLVQSEWIIDLTTYLT